MQCDNILYTALNDRMMRLYVARREKNANVGLRYEGVTVERNVRYGERKYQTFSLYRKSERTLPIVINFHGGGVVGRTKNSRRAFCVSIARELDVAVMNVEYRGETRLGARACLEEVEKLFPYLKESAKSLALDVDKVFLVGDGIGAYLASYLATVAPALEKALNELNMLVGCEAHSTVMLPESSLKIFRRLGINITCEPIFAF